MIVRILEEGQYEVPDADIEALEALDAKLETAIDNDDSTGYLEALSRLTEQIRCLGTPVDADKIVSSELTIPHEGTSLEDMKRLLASDDATEV